jgi:hypothetical protein
MIEIDVIWTSSSSISACRKSKSGAPRKLNANTRRGTRHGPRRCTEPMIVTSQDLRFPAAVTTAGVGSSRRTSASSWSVWAR